MTKLFLVPLLFLSACSSRYSNGYRAGILRKCSYKGAFCKSWEGEMLLNYTHDDRGAVVPDVWSFSIDPNPQNGENTDDIVKQLSGALDSGKRVKIHYVQYTRPRLCVDSSYMIQKVEILK